MLVAAAQLGPVGDRAELPSRIVSLIEQAADAGVRLMVLPELALSPYFCAFPDADASLFANELGDEFMAPIIEAIVTNAI